MQFTVQGDITMDKVNTTQNNPFLVRVLNNHGIPAFTKTTEQAKPVVTPKEERPNFLKRLLQNHGIPVSQLYPNATVTSLV